MIVIGYNYAGKVISIVNTKSEELANAYWQGAGIYPYRTSILEKDFTPIEEHITGVYPLLRTEEIKLYVEGKHETFLVVRKDGE